MPGRRAALFKWRQATPPSAQVPARHGPYCVQALAHATRLSLWPTHFLSKSKKDKIDHSCTCHRRLSEVTMASPEGSVEAVDSFDPSKPFMGVVICCTSIPPEQRVNNLGLNTSYMGT